jgi:Flp pilus assembly protein TadD
MMGAYRREILLCLALFLSSVVVFGQTRKNGLLTLDDPRYVAEQREVFTGLSVENAVWAFTTFHCANWHPLTWLSLQLDVQLYGREPWGFHLTNILLHAANTVLLFLALLVMTGAAWRSSIVAAFFAFHPLHVESVAWIAERKDVLSTFFWMATCLAYGWYARRPGWLRYLLTLSSFAAGLLAKPMVVTLPFVLLLLDYWPLGRFDRNRSSRVHDPSRKPAESRKPEQAERRRLDHSRLTIQHAAQGTHVPRSAPLTTHHSPLTTLALLLLEKLPFFVLAGGSCVVTWYAQKYGEAIRSIEDYPIFARAANALLSYCAYIIQTLWPMNLGLYYPHPLDLIRHQKGLTMPAWPVVGAALALMTATAAICARVRFSPYLAVGWFWYLGTLVPVIGLVMVGSAARADRYTYVPLVGLFVAAVWGVAELAGRWRIQKPAAALAAILVIICVVLTWNQLGYWRSNVTVWHHTLQACGESAVARSNLAKAYFDEGKYDLAVQHYREVIRLNPNYPTAEHDLGISLARLGKFEEAEEQFRIAVRKNPRWARPHYHRGLALRDLGRRQEAMEEFNEALRQDEGWATAHLELGKLFFAGGRYTDAADHFRSSLELGYHDPDNYYGLGRSLVRLGKFADAIDPLTRAVSLVPHQWHWRCLLGFALDKSGATDAAKEQYQEVSRLHAAWREALNQEALVLATHPDSGQRNGDQALEAAQMLCQATGNRDARFLDTLAVAYAETGKYALAVATARQALEVASSNHQEKLVEEIKERLQNYEKRLK